MSNWKRIFDYAQGDRRLIVERDDDSGNVTIQGGVVELTPDAQHRLSEVLRPMGPRVPEHN